MCGLILSVGDSHMWRTMAGLSEMLHRGFRNRRVDYSAFSMGHVRLPIQGLSEVYDCPYEKDEWTVMLVGEIFNYKEFDPEAQSDIKVLIDNYTRNGKTVFNLFDGFWAVVIYNDNTKLIDVFTDHLAKKPLYIGYNTPRDFTIASEIGAVLQTLEKKDFDPLYLSRVSKWGYSNCGDTPFKNIYKIPPNAHLVIDPVERTIFHETGYLQFPHPNKNWTHDMTSIRSALEVAVGNRLVSDIPVSILMSGGLDSTIIFELLKKMTHDIVVFHVDNDEAEYLDYIDFEGIPVREISLDMIRNRELLLEHILINYDCPVDLGSMIPQYLLSEAIENEGFNVAISGDGADELFGGYRRIEQYDSQQSDVFDELVYYHLPRLDRLMMANTVELRCPYLSSSVMNLALSLPYLDRINKTYLKRAFSDIVPREILDRKKEPLKIKDIREDKMAHRLKVIRKFKEAYRYNYSVEG